MDQYLSSLRSYLFSTQYRHSECWAPNPVRLCPEPLKWLVAERKQFQVPLLPDQSISHTVSLKKKKQKLFWVGRSRRKSVNSTYRGVARGCNCSGGLCFLGSNLFLFISYSFPVLMPPEISSPSMLLFLSFCAIISLTYVSGAAGRTPHHLLTSDPSPLH